MSKHYLTAIHDPDGSESEVRIHFEFRAGFAGRYHVDPQPPEDASVEFDRVEMFVLGQWIEAPKLSEWAESYLQGDGQPDAFETVSDDQAEGEDRRAEMRADWAREDRRAP